MKLCLECGHSFLKEDWICPECYFAPESTSGLPSFAPDLADENENFPKHSFAQLAKLEENSFWFRSRRRLILWCLERYFPKTESFLELGCGTAYALMGIQSRFPDLCLFGSDIHLTGLSFAKKRVPEATLFQMDACKIPYQSEFDVIGAFDVIEHIHNDEEALRQMWQAAKPNGGIIITVPQHQCLWSSIDDYGHHKRRYSRRELITKTEKAGFEVLRATSFVSILLPLMFLSRLRQPSSKTDIDPEVEFKISCKLNRILECVMTFERILIKAGLTLPVGGSLILIAAKR